MERKLKEISLHHNILQIKHPDLKPFLPWSGDLPKPVT